MAVVWALLTYVGYLYVPWQHRLSHVKDGDLVFTYHLEDYRQGDAVVYRHDETVHFGRVIALPGDMVDLTGDYVTVNGYGLYEETVYPTSAQGAALSFPYTNP